MSTDDSPLVQPGPTAAAGHRTNDTIANPGRVMLASQGRTPDGRRTYLATFITAGHVKQADGQDAPWLIPASVLERDAALFDGLACYLDHPDLFGFGFRGEPKVRDLFGVTSRAGYDPDLKAVTGQITLYDQDPNGPGAFVAQLLDQILADQEAGKPVPSLGLSAVFYQDVDFDEDTGHKITTAFKKVESVDLVYSPGAGGYIRQALAAIRPHTVAVMGDTHIGLHHSPQRSNTMPEELNPTPAPDPKEHAEMSDELDVLTDSIGLLQDKVRALSAEVDDPPVTDDQHKSTLEDLHAQVQHLTGILAGRETPIEGVGEPVSLAPRFMVSDPLDEIQRAWDWIFGAPDALTPNPELRRTDYLYRLLSGDLNWTGVFDEREALAAANATTMAGMVVNAMNKVIIPLYDRLSVYRWYEQVVKVQPTDGTLHDMAWLQFGGIGDLPVVADGAAYSELAVDDSKETAAFTKYGGYVGITEKVIRNSDVAKLQAVPQALTIAAVQTRSAKIASIFSQASGTGPTLGQDSVVLFHTVSHGNLATTAFSWTAWKAARIECAKQAELASSKRTGFFPSLGLFPVDLYDEALQVFGYGAGPGGQPGTANNDQNPFGVGRPGDPRPRPIMVPDWTDTNNWAYLVDPVIAPVIQMAYADNPSGNGHPAPQLYTVTSKLAGLMFTNDVLPIKVRDYFAYGVATYRGIGKRNVA